MRKAPLQALLVWQCYLLAAILGLLAAVWPCPAGLGLILLAFFDRRLWSGLRLLILLTVFCAALVYAHYQLDQGYRTLAQAPQWINSANRFCATVRSGQGMTGARLRLILSDVQRETGEELPGLCLFSWQDAPFRPLPGQQICLTRPVQPVSGFGNQAGDSWQSWLLGQKIYWRVWSEGNRGDPVLKGKASFSARLRAELQERFVALLWPGQARELQQGQAILVALLFGDRSYLSQRTAELFAAGAIAHSLALSGQHLAIAGFMGLLLVLGAVRFAPGLYLGAPRRLLIFCVAMPLALLYLWLGSAPASLIRAFAMLAFCALWFVLGRPFSGLDLLCAALLAILACSPLAIYDIGLQMSALCVCVILLAAPALARMLPRKSGSWLAAWRNKLLLALLVSLLIQVALLPLGLARFQIAGSWFALNIFWLPLLGFVVLPCAAMSLCLCLLPWHFGQQLAAGLACVAAAPADLVLRLLEWLAGAGILAEPFALQPHWTAIMAFALLAVALAWLASGNRARVGQLVCVALALLAAGPLLRLERLINNRILIEAIDVGQGQAILAQLPGGLRFLVDGGGSYQDRFDPGRQIVAPLTAENAAPELAAVINTHPDLDHLGGLFYILDSFAVGGVFANGRDAPKARTVKWQDARQRFGAPALVAGDRIVLGDPRDNLNLEVLYPPADEPELKGNAASLILRLTRNGHGLALFTGDAEKAGQQWVLNHFPDISAELVFAPHHGSDKNLWPDFYRHVRPKVVIASCGYMNRWHYPGRKLAALLAARGIKLLDTGSCGRIRAAFDDNGSLELKTWRDRARSR